jgi:hypothetical protein
VGAAEKTLGLSEPITPPEQRDLASTELWGDSLARSQRRREIAAIERRTASRERRRNAHFPAALSFAAAVLVAVPLAAGPRAAVVLPVALVAPGLAACRVVHLCDRPLRLTLSIPLSAALCVLVAQASVYAHVWSPRGALAAILTATAGAFLLGREGTSYDDRGRRDGD